MQEHGPEARRYAAHILRADFGEVVEKVASRLLTHGPAALSDLVRTLQLPQAHIKNALLVLTQQNIVESMPRTDADGSTTITRGAHVLYKVLIDPVLFRPWFPRMLVLARELFGNDAVLLLEQLFVCGRLSSEDLLHRAAAQYAAQHNLGPGDKREGAKLLSLHAVASQLQAAQFICHAPVLPAALLEKEAKGLHSSQPASHQPLPSTGGRKRKGKDLTPVLAKKPPSFNYSASTAIGVANAPIVGMLGGQPLPSSVGNALWRANVTRFVTEIRHQSMMSLVEDKLDLTARELVRFALEMQSLANSEKPSCTAPFTIDQLLSKCGSTLDGNAASWQLVCNYMDTMCNDPLCKMASTLNGKYILNLSEMGSAIKQLVLENAIRERFGEMPSRLYKLLLRSHAQGGGYGERKPPQKLELKQMAEMSLLPEREARPFMMRFLRHEYVCLQEVARSNDHNPKTTTFLWYVDLPMAYKKLEQEMLKTLCSLLARLEYEEKQQVHAFAALQTEGVAFDDFLERLTENERREVQLAQRKADLLNNTILHIHHTMMLLRTV
ncbi:hypothetical protein AB1Y20_008059 [Prymnesium parvum]|uniref:DNA-directed RNA polymerase III subunit RPC3 n=1 Tax=Prymnesium parvum TaxID=97485 RepID=A0AB34IUE1_PRYPA